MAMFAVSMAVSATASAKPTWWTCKEVGAGFGSWENNLCTKAKAGGGWEWIQMAEKQEVTSSDILKLSDRNGLGKGKPVTLECTGTDAGTVGPESEDEVTKIEATKCVVIEGECPTPNTKAVHLPWKTELREETGGEIRDAVKNSGAGTPGWQVTCGGIVKDTCEAEGSAGLENVESTGEVIGKFDGKTKKAKCSIGGEESGEVTGTDKQKGVKERAFQFRNK
ncbi:MAG TPA: hypothetical protein VNY52_13965 [Solirubrobacteraceae bacterium]|nr:hypothetical protein [Solirubrobacteraceae bacterium]